MKVIVKSGVLSFNDLFKPKSFEGSGDEKFSANILITPDTKFIVGGKSIKLKALLKLCDKLFMEKTQKKSVKAGYDNWFVNKADGSTTRKPYISQKTDEYYAGVDEDTYYLSGSKKAEDCENGKMLVLDQLKQPITSPSKMYSGCIVSVVFDVYAYAGKKSKGVTASLEGIQKIADGERLGGERVNAIDDFDEVEVDDDFGDDVEIDEDESEDDDDI